ncbi:uncharacterized protein LOC112049275 isoform X3 [Bicyclus anynana]|uniref:Uncharacterized protein LOC112049275 isoform X3 n=1 Tax=Bicyclus anynana TaxID=110368 RepID=A0ABM3LVC3_BICAN|nr:uncharacterized protein LOC112049275 isoform X3 [Bicyclus anynana]
MAEPEPLILCMENINGEEVELTIEPHDTFQDFQDKAKLLLGYDVDINSITGNQPVSLEANIYNFLLKAEQHFEGTTLDPDNFDEIIDHNKSDDLVYILDDGTQIRASQIQFDNDDPLVDLTSEKIPFVKYKEESDEEIDDVVDTNVTIKNINITDSPVASRNNESSKCSFANSLPFNLVCNNTLNFEAQFAKYLESSAKTYTDLKNVTKNKSPESVIGDNYKSYDNRSDGLFTREDILNMFKDAPVTPLPYEDNQTEKRRHIRKTDPARVVYKNWNAKPITDIGSGLEKHNCFICCESVKNNEKLYLFDKEDQMLHRCEQRKYNMQLKIICDRCLTENFKPSRNKSPTQSLDDNEYLVIKNNQQFIFQKSSNINLKSSYFINNINMNNINNNNTEKVDKLNKPIRHRESEDFVKVEIGPDGEIVTKPVDNDVKYDDVIIVKDKKDSSSDIEIIEPEVNEEAVVEIDVDNIEDADDDVKEFLGKYKHDFENIEFKCRFCEKQFENLDQAMDHCDEHKHDVDDGVVFPCPLCDYGYANSKWLKAHLKAAHNNTKREDIKEENAIKEENSRDNDNEGKKNVNSEEITHTPESSPVAKRTRSSLKRNDVDINNGTQEQLQTKESLLNHTQEQENVKMEVKQECQDSSDSDSIWIVQTGDDDNQLKKLLQVTEGKRNVNDLKRHKCFSCSQIFPNAESLRTHKCRKRVGKRQFNLTKKESVSPTLEDFIKRHRKRKTRGPNDPQIVTCHNCNESFTSKVRLKFHMQFHEATNLLTSDGQYMCAECKDTSFANETKLFDHVHFQHNKQKRWQCPVKDCGKTFFLRATLTKHSRMHTDTRRYVCVTCGKRFLDKQTLDEHGVTHLQIKPFQCHICLKQLTRRSRLRMHLRAHEEELSPALVLVCAMCSRAFRDHVDAQDCGRSYLHWTYFQVHRRMKHANENYIFKCNQCELTFPNSWSATYHRKKVHSNSQDANGGFTKVVRENYRIPCRDCDEVLPNKIALYKHRQKEHCDETLMEKEDDWSDQVEPETTVCNYCGLDLHFVVALEQHVKEVHGCSAEARASAHACSVCARTFRSASMRDEHVRVHTGERPFPCDVCGVAFRRSTAMRNHRLLHTGTRPWCCARCPKRFRVKSDLRTHIRLKHPAHLSVIEIEGRSCTQEEVLQHLDNNNISRDKVIEITMITFPKNTTNIVPNSVRALSMLNNFPKSVIPCNWKSRVVSGSEETFQPPRRGRGIDKNPRKPAILQRCDDLPQTSRDTSAYVHIVEGENLPSLDVQLLLQSDVIANKNRDVPVEDGVLLQQTK